MCSSSFTYHRAVACRLLPPRSIPDHLSAEEKPDCALTSQPCLQRCTQKIKMNRPDLSAPASQGCPTAGFVGTTMSPGLTPATFPNTGVPPNQSMQQSPTFTMQARMPFSSGPRMGYPGDAYTRPSPLPIFNMATPGSPAPGPGPVFFRVEPRPTSNFQQFRHEVCIRKFSFSLEMRQLDKINI